MTPGEKRARIPREGPCSVANCASDVFCRGMCSLHYERVRLGHGVDGSPRVRQVGDWGAWSVNNNGYVIRKRRIAPKKFEVQLQHRYVMEGVLGRALQGDENVHHINGNREDSTPENLELWSTRQPKGQRVSDKVAWAKELLALYEPEALKESE